MLLVTGATGQLGRAAIDCLLQDVPAGRVAVLVRDPRRAGDLAARGVEVRRGDYTDRRSLDAAFDGVEKLLLVSTNALEGVAGQHANAIGAAKAAGVGHVVFTSMFSRSDPPRIELVREYRRSEDDLVRSGIAYTILRNGYYMDMLPMFIGDAPQSGRLRYPAGQGRTNFTARSDLAEAAAKVLTGAGHENRVYQLCGNEACSFGDIAGVLGEVIGRKIDYVDIPAHEYEAALRDGGMAPPEVGLMVAIAHSVKHDEGRCPDGELQPLLGREPLGLREFLGRTYRPAAG